jgi:hypothetical protein
MVFLREMLPGAALAVEYSTWRIVREKLFGWLGFRLPEF